MKGAVLSVIIGVGLFFGSMSVAAAFGGIMTPGSGGYLTPSVMTLTNDGGGVIPSNLLNIGSLNQYAPKAYLNYVFASTGIGIGTSTAVSLLTVSKTPLGTGVVATTTVDFGDYSTTTSVMCFNTKNASGTPISFYFSGTSMVVESNRCK